MGKHSQVQINSLQLLCSCLQAQVKLWSLIGANIILKIQPKRNDLWNFVVQGADEAHPKEDIILLQFHKNDKITEIHEI